MGKVPQNRYSEGSKIKGTFVWEVLFWFFQRLLGSYT